MEWQFMALIMLAIPVILFPAAFVWYLNIGGIYAAIKEARKRKAEAKKSRLVEPDTGAKSQARE